MRAAILSKPGEIQVTDLPEPIPGPGELKIAVRRVGICGSDLARFEGHLPQKRAVVFGHEFSGRVVAWGAGVTSYTPGQPVTVAPLLNCGHCEYCKQDKGYLCPERIRFGADVSGAMQEFVCVPAERAYLLPAQLPLEYGAVAEPLAVALHAIHQVETTKGLDAAILGGGAIGLLIALGVRAMGATTVSLVDILPERVALAEQLGFQGILANAADPVEVVLQITGGQGVQILFEASGSPHTAGYFLPMLASQGTIVVVGRVHKPVALDLDALLMKEAQLVTSRYFSLADFAQAVDMIASGTIDVRPLIQKTMKLSDLEQDHGRMVMQAARKSIRLMIDLADNQGN